MHPATATVRMYARRPGPTTRQDRADADRVKLLRRECGLTDLAATLAVRACAANREQPR